MGRLIGRKVNQVSDLLRGRSAFGERVARSIEEAAGLPVGWLDEPIAPAALAFSLKGIGASAAPAVRVSLHERAMASPANSLQAPLSLTLRWLEQFEGLSDTAKLRLVPVQDDAMEPTVGAGDLLLVDTGANRCERDGLYLLWVDPRLQVRRVRRRLDGMLEVSADNPAIKGADVIDPQDLQVLGAVLWSWRGRKF